MLPDPEHELQLLHLSPEPEHDEHFVLVVFLPVPEHDEQVILLCVALPLSLPSIGLHPPNL